VLFVCDNCIHFYHEVSNTLMLEDCDCEDDCETAKQYFNVLP